jgi:hypothetical protein
MTKWAELGSERNTIKRRRLYLPQASSLFLRKALGVVRSSAAKRFD